jgi:hypothetical protein
MTTAWDHSIPKPAPTHRLLPGANFHGYIGGIRIAIQLIEIASGSDDHWKVRIADIDVERLKRERGLKIDSIQVIPADRIALE